MTSTSPSSLPRTVMPALCTGVAALTAAMAVAGTAGTLLADDQLGAVWAGVPNTAGIVGTGTGALLLSRVIGASGPRAGLAVGYAAAVVGAAAALVGAVVGQVAVLAVGMLLLGVGNGAAQLARYAAAARVAPARRGSAIATVVGAATVGAVGAPLLLQPSGAAAGRFGLAGLVGPFLLAAIAAVIALASAALAPVRGRPPAARLPVRELMVEPVAATALLTMAMAQVVMVLVMTAAPMDMHARGAGLTSIGAIVSAHTLGMFLFSPVTGAAVDRYGARPVMALGLITMTAAVMLACIGEEAVTPARTAGLFLLGCGWNLCFIGGSSLLSRGLPELGRTQVEGTVDAVVWGVAAAAGLASTGLLSAGGYQLLAMTTVGLVLAPLLLLAQAGREAPAAR